MNEQNQLLIPNVFGGLLTVIVLGLAVENLVFRTIEIRTVRRGDAVVKSSQNPRPYGTGLWVDAVPTVFRRIHSPVP